MIVAVTGLLIIVMFIVSVGALIQILGSGDFLLIILTVPFAIAAIVFCLWVAAAIIFKE